MSSFRRAYLHSLALPVALLAIGGLPLAGCGSSSAGNSTSTGTGGASSTATSGSGGGPQMRGDACSRFLACATQSQPQSLPGAQAAYGPEGACWTTQTATQCEQQCTDALSGLHQLDPSASECAVCRSDMECAGAMPACSKERGECVACTSAAQCQAPSPACDAATNTCVACVADADCQAPLGACDTTTHTCVACTMGSQCKSGRCEDDHSCCVPESPCSAGSCGSIADNCGKQVSCGGCGAKEYCGDSSEPYCHPITDTFECHVSGSPAEQCPKNTSYCEILTTGAGSGSAHCKNVPAACLAQFTCACLLAQHVYYPPDTCHDGTGPNGAGSMIVYEKL